MPLITRKEILEQQYNDLYPALEISKVGLEALKILPPSLQLEPRYSKSDFGLPIREERTVAQRIKEIERDIQVLGARVEIIQRELEKEPKE